jgi:hypothetical protein
MNVDVDILARKVEEQREHCMAIAGQHIGIGTADRAGQQAVFHRAAIDEQILVVGNAAIIGWQAGNPGQPHRAAFHIDGDPIVLEFAGDQLRHPVCKPFPAL